MLRSIMTKPGRIEFQNIEKPKITPDEILMRTKRIGVCGSDIHVFHGLHPYTSYPIVQGHEVAGAGHDAHPVAAGDASSFDQFLGGLGHLGADPAELIDLWAALFQLKAGFVCHRRSPDRVSG